jgi:hypothetical protein
MLSLVVAGSLELTLPWPRRLVEARYGQYGWLKFLRAWSLDTTLLILSLSHLVIIMPAVTSNQQLAAELGLGQVC